MRLFSPFRSPVLLLVLAVCSAAAQARASDPLMAKAQTLMQANQGLVANEMSNAFVAESSGSPAITGAYKTSLNGWVNDQPVRDLSEKTAAAEKSFELAKLDLFVGAIFADHPDEFFATAGRVARVPDQMWKGKLVAVRNLQASATKKQSGYAATVFLEPASGAPVRANVTWFNVRGPGVKSVNAVIHFAPDEQGRILPREIVANYKINQRGQPTQVSVRKLIYTWSRTQQP